ncbi:MAG: UPF0175 family protein [Anaerolineales bacterium]
MSTITWNIPRETLFALKGSTEEVGIMLRMASAVKLYEMGKLSSGAAARLAGVPRAVFLSRLAETMGWIRFNSAKKSSNTRLV